MRKERLEILEKAYNEAIQFNSMDSGYKVTFNEIEANNFDYQYLSNKGLIKVESKFNLDSFDPLRLKYWYVTITSAGVDTIEEYLEENGQLENYYIRMAFDELSKNGTDFEAIEKAKKLLRM